MRSSTFTTALFVALALNLAIASTARSDAPHPPPNILIILADDLGFSDLGCYGGEIATPRLDRLAANGLRFTQFYNTSRCWPTRASILTGYYAQEVRRDSLPGLKSGGQGTRPPWAPLISVWLQEAGYRTYHSGKWHIDGQPLENGFDHSYDVKTGGQNTYFAPQGNTIDGQPDDAGPGYYVTTAVAEHAIECLREHATKHPSQPFFYYLCFTAPHFPLQALPEDIAKYRGSYDRGWNALAQERYNRLLSLGIVDTPLAPMEEDLGPPYHFPEALEILGPNELNRPLPWDVLTPEQRAFQAAKMEIHAAMVDRMDHEIGRVIDQLSAMGALDNTLILFLSDNGASAEIMVRGEGHDPDASMGSRTSYLCLGPGFSSAANTPFRRHKSWTHEGGIATPFIAHWPAGIADRSALRHQVSHVIDVVPTILELARIEKPTTWGGQTVPPAPGRSLLPVFRSESETGHQLLWWYHDGHRALRRGHLKVVAARGDPWALYDLSTDRAETRNLAPYQPDLARELADAWHRQLEEIMALHTGSAP